MQAKEAERQRGRVWRRISKLGTDSVAVDEITRAREADGDKNEGTRCGSIATRTLLDTRRIERDRLPFAHARPNGTGQIAAGNSCHKATLTDPPNVSVHSGPGRSLALPKGLRRPKRGQVLPAGRVVGIEFEKAVRELAQALSCQPDSSRGAHELMRVVRTLDVPLETRDRCVQAVRIRCAAVHGVQVDRDEAEARLAAMRDAL